MCAACAAGPMTGGAFLAGRGRRSCDRRRFFLASQEARCRAVAPGLVASLQMTDTTDIAKMSFETALAELERIVAELESGKAELERSIEVYERGAALKAHCEAKLKEAQL